MHTEEEAKTKWCQELTSPDPSGKAYVCCGSKCMAWRWAERVRITYVDRSHVGDDYNPPKTGYCGKAGKP